MTGTTNLAARLLAFAPTTEVVDALLPVAHLTTGAVRVAAAPSTAAATQTARRGVKYAVSMANAPVHDPDLLARLGKMPQKSVRRLVAANSDTPIGTLVELSKWALETGDDETLDALCATLPPPQWLPTMLKLRSVEYSVNPRVMRSHALPPLPVESIVAQLVRRGDPAVVWDTYRLGVAKLNREIAKSATRGDLCVSAAELLQDTDQKHYADVIDSVVSCTHVVLDRFVIAKVVSHVQRYGANLEDGHQRRLHAARQLDADSVQSFVYSGEPLLRRCVAASANRDMCVVTDDQLAHLVENACTPLAGELLTSEKLRPRLSSAQLARVATLAAPDSKIVGRMLKGHGADLPSEARVNLVRNGERNVTAQWISGEYGFLPTLEEVAAVAAVPGRSVSAVIRTWTVGEYLDEFADSFDVKAGHNPAMADLFNAGGRHVLHRAAQAKPGGYQEMEKPNAFTAYLAQRLSDTFGTNPEAWRVAAVMAQHSPVETVDEFLDVVAGMVAPAPATVPA